MSWAFESVLGYGEFWLAIGLLCGFITLSSSIRVNERSRSFGPPSVWIRHRESRRRVLSSTAIGLTILIGFCAMVFVVPPVQTSYYVVGLVTGGAAAAIRNYRSLVPPRMRAEHSKAVHQRAPKVVHEILIVSAVLLGLAIWQLSSYWSVLLQGLGFLGILIAMGVAVAARKDAISGSERWNVIGIFLGFSAFEAYMAVRSGLGNPGLVATYLSFGTAYLIIGASIFLRKDRRSA